jgi:ferredoxin-NADP reductase
MITYEVRLAQSAEIADGTMAFHFSKPAGFSFKPGQAIDLVLTDPTSPDAEGLRHTFSIVAAPFEGELEFATRMRDSAYKRALRSLPVGAAARIEGPSGSLVLHEDRARAAVFIAGGIGITPFMSILRQAAQDQLPQHLRLLYSNRRPEDAAFLAELQQLEQRNKNFRLVATMTKIGKSNQPWNGETVSIDDTFLKTAAGELAVPIYYVAGPPAMVEEMCDTLNGMGVDDGDIRSEDFYGY